MHQYHKQPDTAALTAHSLHYVGAGGVKQTFKKSQLKSGLSFKTRTNLFLVFWNGCCQYLTEFHWPSILLILNILFTAIADHPGGVKQQKVRIGTSKGRAVTHTSITQSPPGTSK